MSLIVFVDKSFADCFRACRCPFWLSVACGCILCLGCGSSAPAKNGEIAKTTIDSDSEAESGPEGNLLVVDASKLPPVGELIPPIGNGVFALAPPAGWNVAGREKGTVGRFYPNDRAGLPRILIRLDSSLIKGIGSFDEETAFHYADEIATTFKENVKVVEEPFVAKIGDRYWVKYVKSARSNEGSVRVVVLSTVFNDQQFTLELQSLTSSSESLEPLLYASAASLKSQLVAETARPEGEEAHSQ